MARRRQPRPLDAYHQAGGVCSTTAGDVHQWGAVDLLGYQASRAWRKLFGGSSPSKTSLAAYKDEWVRYHACDIVSVASTYGLAPEALAGIAWTEVGGDPDFVDRIAFSVRRFDHLADPYLEPLTTTRRPELTSVGDVSIQIRRVAEAIGITGPLSGQDQAAIVALMSDERFNLAVVARHIRGALDRLDPSGMLKQGDDRTFLLIGYLYNLGDSHALVGVDNDLDEIPRRGISNYGHDLLKKRGAMRALLRLPERGTGR